MNGREDMAPSLQRNLIQPIKPQNELEGNDQNNGGKDEKRENYTGKAKGINQKEKERLLNYMERLLKNYGEKKSGVKAEGRQTEKDQEEAKRMRRK